MTMTTNIVPVQLNGTTGKFTTRELEESVGTLPVLGYSTQWNLCQIEIAHSDLVKSLQTRGFFTTDPERPSPTVALRRAMIRWVHNRAVAAGDTSTTQGLWSGDVDGYDSEGEAEEGEAAGNGKGRSRAKKSLLRKINSPQSEWLVFGLVIEQLDLAALGLSYATRLRVFLHKKTLTIKVSRAEAGFEPTSLSENEEEDEELSSEPELAAITAEIRQLFHYYREHHQARDVSMLLKQLVAGLDSFSLRRLGGVYFVPQQHQQELENLRELVEDLPATAGQVSDKFMLKLPILDGAGAKKQLAQAAHRDFLLELSTMQSDLNRLTEEATHHQLRADTVARRLTTYRELKAKAEVYAELLDMQQGRILTAVEKLTGQAAQLLDNLTDYALQRSDHQQSFDWDNLNPDPGGTQLSPQLEVTVVPA
jgi:hypothetical protein